MRVAVADARYRIGQTAVARELEAEVTIGASQPRGSWGGPAAKRRRRPNDITRLEQRGIRGADDELESVDREEAKCARTAPEIRVP